MNYDAGIGHDSNNAIMLLGCEMPLGSYLENCDALEYNPITSSEGIPMCLLETTCYVNNREDDIHNGIAPVANSILLPTNTHLADVESVNGVLTYGGKALSLATVNHNSLKPVIESYKCTPIGGSYSQTCNVKVENYKSSDHRLANTALCEAEIVCKKLDGAYGEKSRVVYFNILSAVKNAVQTTVQLIENCDGTLVIGGTDNMCKSAENAAKLGKTHGRTGDIRLNRNEL